MGSRCGNVDSAWQIQCGSGAFSVAWVPLYDGENQVFRVALGNLAPSSGAAGHRVLVPTMPGTGSHSNSRTQDPFF